MYIKILSNTQYNVFHWLLDIYISVWTWSKHLRTVAMECASKQDKLYGNLIFKSFTSLVIGIVALYKFIRCINQKNQILSSSSECFKSNLFYIFTKY